MKQVIVDVSTGDVIIEDLPAEHIAEMEKFNKNQTKLDMQRQAEVAAKDAARKAVLDKLGLTADEAAALLG